MPYCIELEWINTFSFQGSNAGAPTAGAPIYNSYNPGY